MSLSRGLGRLSTTRMRRFCLVGERVLKPRVSKALKTPLSSCLFLEMGSMLSIDPKNSGKGDDLFLLNLLTTCLKVSKYPA